MSLRQLVQRKLEVSGQRLAIALGLTILAATSVVLVTYNGLMKFPADASTVAVGLLGRHGYLALLGVFVLEGLMILYFAPSESLVPAAIIAFGTSPTSLVMILIVGIAGATIGQVALFVIVQRTGREYILKQSWIAVSEPQLARFDAWFGRWGPLVVPVSNTLLFVRGMVTIPAGLSDMRLRTFAVLSAVGTLCFEVALTALTLGLLGTI